MLFWLVLLAVAIISPPVKALGVDQPIGPSFDCAKASQPLARLICTSPALSRADLEFNQAYHALRKQLDPAGRSQLQQEDLEFLDYVKRFCGVPDTGALTGSVDCVGAQYDRQREKWLSRLSGSAREEAKRPIERNIALQADLQRLGFLPATEKIDGVYGAGTRAAIVAWQSATGRPSTGSLGDADAVALGQGAVTQPPGKGDSVTPPSSSPTTPAAMLGCPDRSAQRQQERAALQHELSEINLAARMPPPGANPSNWVRSPEQAASLNARRQANRGALGQLQDEEDQERACTKKVQQEKEQQQAAIRAEQEREARRQEAKAAEALEKGGRRNKEENDKRESKQQHDEAESLAADAMRFDPNLKLSFGFLGSMDLTLSSLNKATASALANKLCNTYHRSGGLRVYLVDGQLAARCDFRWRDYSSQCEAEMNATVATAKNMLNQGASPAKVEAYVIATTSKKCKDEAEERRR